MLNLFYQKNTLNDTLIINVSNTLTTKVVSNNDVTIGYKDDQIVFVNIKNASKSINGLVDGLLFPTKELMEQVNKLVGTDLNPLFTNGFKVATIESCEDISGTHLHKCKVNVGDKVLDIVCGAPNARTGLKTVCAISGTMLPDGKQIVPGALLGNKSEGMLCSYRELMIDKPSNGIIELGENDKVGDYFFEAYANKR